MKNTYDLDTPGGMANAVVWVNRHMCLLRDGGQWLVPRSGTIVTLLDHRARKITITEGKPDPSIRLVLEEAGWTVTPQENAHG